MHFSLKRNQQDCMKEKGFRQDSEKAKNGGVQRELYHAIHAELYQSYIMLGPGLNHVELGHAIIWGTYRWSPITRDV